MFSLLISDGFLGSGVTGHAGDLSMEGHSGRISPISGVGEGAGEVEGRRNLKGFLALIGKLAAIGRFLTWICSGICGSNNNGGRFFKGGDHPDLTAAMNTRLNHPRKRRRICMSCFQ
jgi:hypothetical protein